MHGDRFIGLPGHDPDGTVHLAPVELDLDDIARGDAIVLGALGRDPHSVVPGHFVLRLRHLLKPRVVGHGSVADRRIGAEYDFESAAAVAASCGIFAAGGAFREAPFPPRHRHAARSARSRRSPCLVLGLPVCLHRIVRGLICASFGRTFMTSCGVLPP